MTEPATFRSVIDLWPTKAAFARDLKTIGGATKDPPVREWFRRDHIPEVWFDPVIKAAAERGFVEVTYRVLASLFRA